MAFPPADGASSNRPPQQARPLWRGPRVTSLRQVVAATAPECRVLPKLAAAPAPLTGAITQSNRGPATRCGRAGRAPHLALVYLSRSAEHLSPLDVLGIPPAGGRARAEGRRRRPRRRCCCCCCCGRRAAILGRPPEGQGAPRKGKRGGACSAPRDGARLVAGSSAARCR
eukprot:scaffold4722_cov417-Prasinococcus_capsulatus_cf.AAC.1